MKANQIRNCEWLETDSAVHIIPIDDLKPHSEHFTCKCQPSIEGSLVIHNSYDGREFLEGENDLMCAMDE